MAASIIDKIRTADKLPSQPAVAMEVLRVTSSGNFSVADIARVVQQDPALTGKILKVANSSLFGMPRKVASVHQAMVFLGLRTVRVMVLSFSLVDTMRDGLTGAFNLHEYWRRSLTMAAAAQLLGKQLVPRMAEEAFVAALLADIGMMAAWRCAQEDYAPVLEAWRQQKRPLCEIEMEMLGVSHAEFSYALLQNWGIPSLLCETVRAHHSTNDCEGLRELGGPALQIGKIVCAAARIAQIFCHETPSIDIDEIKGGICRHTGIAPQLLEQVLEILDKHALELASLLAVELGPTMDYAELQTEAALQLAQLSMQAEVERAQTSQQAEQMREQMNRMQEEHQVMLVAASTDKLTNIANRSGFDDHLAAVLKDAKSRRQAVSLIMIDVDEFKNFNDTHGHQAGDEVLRNVGTCLKEVCEDIGFAARYGGEEFAVVLASEAAGQLREMAEEIRRSIEGSVVKYDGKRLRVTASCGATSAYPSEDNTTPEKLVERADRLLYRAKRNGRNRVESDRP